MTHASSDRLIERIAAEGTNTRPPSVRYMFTTLFQQLVDLRQLTAGRVASRGEAPRSGLQSRERYRQSRDKHAHVSRKPGQTMD